MFWRKYYQNRDVDRAYSLDYLALRRYRELVCCLTVVGRNSIVVKYCEDRARKMLGEFLICALSFMQMSANAEDTCEKMYSVQNRYHDRVRRRRRKYEVLTHMWDAVIKCCREFLMHGDAPLLQHFQGVQLL